MQGKQLKGEINDWDLDDVKYPLLFPPEFYNHANRLLQIRCLKEAMRLIENKGGN